MGTGLIYAAIVAAWAAYLVPLWLRRQDEVAASRRENFSGSARVLQPRVPDTGDTYASRSSRASAGVDEFDDDAAALDEWEPEYVEPGPGRPYRTAASRRRRTLFVLLLATTGTAGAAAFGLLPWWAVGVPGGLIVAFLAASAAAVRAARRDADRSEYGEADDGEPAEPEEPEAATDEAGPADGTATSTESSGSIRAQARPGQVWDPISVPLPTYVNKPKAPRTVRTIDLSEDDTWTSGRLSDPAPADASAEAGSAASTGAEESEASAAEQPGAVPEPVPEPVPEHRRAVGD